MYFYLLILKQQIYFLLENVVESGVKTCGQWMNVLERNETRFGKHSQSFYQILFQCNKSNFMKCSCDYCKRFADDEDQLLFMNADEFKEKMFALHNFPRHLRDEVDRSDLSYMHIWLGIVPERMSQETFLKIIRIEELKFNKHIGLPLLPAVQHSWSGSRVADWLISGGMVNESKRSIITEKLDGCRFLEGDINGILTKEEIDTVNSKLAKGISKRSSQVFDRFKSSPMRSAFFRRIFYMDLNHVSSTEEVERMFKQDVFSCFSDSASR